MSRELAMHDKNLTRRLLEAMEEALMSRTAAEMDVEDIPTEDYQDALTWVQNQLERRERKPAKLAKRG